IQRATAFWAKNGIIHFKSNSSIPITWVINSHFFIFILALFARLPRFTVDFHCFHLVFDFSDNKGTAATSLASSIPLVPLYLPAARVSLVHPYFVYSSKT